MRFLMLMTLILTVSGCTAMLLGGGNSGDSRPERGSRTSAQISIDGRITAAVRDRMAADSVLGDYDVSVQTFDNRVTLRGSVGTYSARERAAQLAAAVEGVDSVDNRIRVDTGQ